MDDNEDMAHLYLTRKCIQNQQSEALVAAGAPNNINLDPNVAQLSSNIHSNASLVTSLQSDDHDVDDLEMLLEAYFMQLDSTRNKILSVSPPSCFIGHKKILMFTILSTCLICNPN